MFHRAVIVGAATTLLLAAGPAAAAGPCDRSEPVVAETWARYRKMAEADGDADLRVALAREDFRKRARAWWDEQIRGPWAGRSLIPLTPGEVEPGTLLAERVYLTPLPTRGPAAVRVRKVRGEAEGHVEVCVAGPGGRNERVARLRIGNGDGDGTAQEVEVPAGRLVTLRFEPPRGLRKIRYEVSLVER